MKEASFQIQGMSCGHCVKAVRQALEDQAGVAIENVEIGAAQVRYDPAVTDRAALVEAIEEAGYDVLQPA